MVATVEAAVAPPRRPDGGYGLRGIRERAATHDGEVEIGPRPQGGYRVRVRYPLGPGGGDRCCSRTTSSWCAPASG